MNTSVGGEINSEQLEKRQTKRKIFRDRRSLQ
jgi:hypothetical protein